MKLALGLACVLTPLLLLTGCPSKDNTASSSGATAPSTSSSAATSATAGNGTGPLANLESQTSVPEAWTGDDGAALSMIYYQTQNVRISASCKQPDGTLKCAAIQQLRNAPPIDLPARGKPSISVGTKACMKLGYPRVIAKNSASAEDGFCKFPDGSMVSTGALEQYAIHILD